jgi:hypothetical protein
LVERFPVRYTTAHTGGTVMRKLNGQTDVVVDGSAAPDGNKEGRLIDSRFSYGARKAYTAAAVVPAAFVPANDLLIGDNQSFESTELSVSVPYQLVSTWDRDRLHDGWRYHEPLRPILTFNKTL